MGGRPNNLTPEGARLDSGEPTAPVLHAFLGVGKDFSTWMPESIEAFGFVEHVDFEVLPNSGFNPQGGRPTKEYMIGLSMAKELAMVQRTAKGKEARLYFIECERKAVKAMVPVNPRSGEQGTFAQF